MRLNLKLAIVASGKSQRRVSAACGISENRFSAIVHGWVDPRDTERGVIAEMLGERVEELFEARQRTNNTNRRKIDTSVTAFLPYRNDQP